MDRLSEKSRVNFALVLRPERTSFAYFRVVWITRVGDRRELTEKVGEAKTASWCTANA